MQTRARIGITLLALAVAGGLVYGFLPRAVPVELVPVARGPLSVTVEEEGKTRVRERYVVSAPMTGYVRRIDLRVGDAVKAGQVVAAIEPSRAVALDPRSRAQATAQVKAADAAVAAARESARAAAAQAELARQELERSEALRKSNFIAEQALDRARTEVARSQAARLAAEHAANVARFELDVARAALARTAGLQAGGPGETIDVRAPVDAQVLKLARESEGAVQAGQSLLEIGNPETLEVEVEVLSTQAVKIAPGSRVLFDRWGGDTLLQGAVRIVEPTGFTKVSALGVEEQRVRVIVDFTSNRDQWRRLGDGYRVEARFVIWEGGDVLQIPAGALFRDRDGWAVYAVEAGRARMKAVQIGQRAGLVAEVKAGLAVGESIVNHPDDKIRDGVKVKPRAP
ncbi:MAG: HlyD family efflux transporter periplasmic adaptor subunit [Betaproteobacteria bacterium]|jgi:HlyD family secretion protein|nr:HlyD family efflux transporter periplasmic adaptor subunit [Betaproteobacteria bacterium]MBK7080461.1 HlyD family efflux transporter periplasmic adaptor subunit [Betaproteobacteria bacterium]MBK7742720.1 HlyD family efflux transporter periplasmic adaptor subunit [Betaproteobacteria bacterium]MBK9674654.1 HlyD family efflux transporter periplasmic adaptor subunit [Betaproteobacteria bacterium]